MQLVVRLVELLRRRDEPRSEAERRYLAIARATLAALSARAVALATSLLLVPLTVHYLGAERYGAWATLSSLLGWLYLADLGLGNGLTNALSHALAQGRDDEARAYVASALWALGGICALLAAALGIAWPFVDWGALLNVSTPAAAAELRLATGLAAALYLAAVPFSLLDRIYACTEDGSTANAWSAADSVCTAAVVFAITRTQGGLVALVAGICGTHLAVSLANAWWLFTVRRPDLRPSWSRVSRAGLHLVSGTGARFFAVQLVGLVLFGTDNLITARVLGASAVTPYSVAFKLFSIPTLLIGLHRAYLWPAYVSAVARGDARWVRVTLARSATASFSLAAVFAVVLAVFGQQICLRWAGPAAVAPQAVFWWMAAWICLEAPSASVSCMLNGAGQLRGQMLYGVVAASANIGLSILFARSYGLAGVIAGTVVSYAVCAAVPAALEALWTLRRLDTRSTP